MSTGWTLCPFSITQDFFPTSYLEGKVAGKTHIAVPKYEGNLIAVGVWIFLGALKPSPLPSRKQAISRVAALKSWQPWSAVCPSPAEVQWVTKPFCLRHTMCDHSWLFGPGAVAADTGLSIPASWLLNCWGAAVWWQLGKLLVFPKWP